MKTENEMNNNGQRTPAAGNGTRKPNFRHKNYRYKAQPKKDGQKFTGQERPVKNTSYKPQLRSQVKPSLKRPRRNLEAGRRLQNGIAAVFKQDPADAPDIRLVVHHENADRFFHT